MSEVAAALAGLVGLAEDAMVDANNDGGMYDVDELLRPARDALAARELECEPAFSAEAMEAGAEGCFLSHWPKDRWSRFGDRDYVKEQYRAMFRNGLAAAWKATREKKTAQ